MHHNPSDFRNWALPGKKAIQSNPSKGKKVKSLFYPGDKYTALILTSNCEIVTISGQKLLNNSWDSNGHNGNNTLPLYLHIPVGFPKCYLTVQRSEAFFALISVSSCWRVPPYLMWREVWGTLYSGELFQVEDLQVLSVQCVPEDLEEKIGNIWNVGFTEKDDHRLHVYNYQVFDCPYVSTEMHSE